MANETIKPYETKMKKSYNNLLDEYTSIRAGRANPHVLDQASCRLLRCTDSYPAGCKRICTGSTHDHDPAMGSIYGESNRESNYDIRHWH